MLKVSDQCPTIFKLKTSRSQQIFFSFFPECASRDAKCTFENPAKSLPAGISSKKYGVVFFGEVPMDKKNAIVANLLKSF